LVFTAVSDEEVGGINGTEFLVDRGLVHPDHVVVGEITHNRLAVAEKGIVWMRVITHGRAAHGSTPWEGANAISAMLRVLQAVEDRVAGRLRSLSHPLVPPPSLNIGTIRGGVATNIVPDWCEATIDRRTLPNENVQAAVAEIEGVVSDLRAEDPQLQVDLEVIQCGPPIETSPDTPLDHTGSLPDQPEAAGPPLADRSQHPRSPPPLPGRSRWAACGDRWSPRTSPGRYWWPPRHEWSQY